MATRKSGDGSRNADVGGESPGSYAKVSGSRRRRKGKRASTLPPPSADLESSRIVDTVGESEDDGRISDLGDTSVDDLRRPSRPSSNRAPRKELGPLGIEDIRSDPPANSAFAGEPDPEPSRTPSDPARVRVVEINSSASRSERSRALFDDEDEEEDLSARDRELADEYALDGNAADVPAPEPIRASVRPSTRAIVRRDDDFDPEEARHSLSSVLGARPSMRPTPRPETQKDPASALWWVVVTALVAIIAAAVTIAAREHIARREEDKTAPEPEAVAAPAEPAAVVAPPPVSFGTPQTAPEVKPEPVPAVVAPEPVKAAAGPETGKRTAASAPDVPPVPPRLSAAVRAGVPGTGVTTGAVAKDTPISAGPAASAAKPMAKSAPKQAAPTYAPGYGTPVAEGTQYAPGYAEGAAKAGRPTLRPGPDPERGKPNLTPMREGASDTAALPANPFE